MGNFLFRIVKYKGIYGCFFICGLILFCLLYRSNFIMYCIFVCIGMCRGGKVISMYFFIRLGIGIFFVYCNCGFWFKFF